jgi:tRNA (adenine57-N1/adenine58-N1)-methyltransferase
MQSIKQCFITFFILNILIKRDYQLNWYNTDTIAKNGDLAQLAGVCHKNFIIRLSAGTIFQSHKGIIPHDEMIGLPWGTQVFTHKGSSFFLLQPSFADLLIETPRVTQILYPKDIGFLMVTLGVMPGLHVLEAGTGSGALTSAFASLVGSTGKVTSYDVKPDFQNLARKNLARLELLDRVDLKLRNIADGFDETNVDILFLDVPDPHNYIGQVRKALKPGGFFGCILPTTNQVSLAIIEMKRNDFIFIEVCEILLRYYKTEPARLRPVDRMVAHTGFLVFGRPVIKPIVPVDDQPFEEVEADLL